MIAMTQPGHALVATAAAAKAIGVSARTLARWAREGSVRPALTTAGRQRRWDVADLRHQLEERERRASRPPEPESEPPVVKRPARRTPPAGRPTSWGRLLDPIDSIHEPPHD